jgi:predicted nucleic acid-binding protein
MRTVGGTWTRAGAAMPLVVDASIAVKFLVREPHNDAARLLLADPEPLIAPDWLLVEAASAFWKKVRRSEMPPDHAERHLETLPEFFESLFPASDLVREALALSLRLGHPVYDCLYLALALREDCLLVTADTDFAAAVARGGLAEKLRRFG